MNNITDSTILDCGHIPSAHASFTTGYGYDANDRTFCYDCAAKLDIASMLEHGSITLYLSNGKVTNWPNSLSFDVIRSRKGRHNIASVRYDVWFNGPDNRVWHGVQYGNNTQICHCKRMKA